MTYRCVDCGSRAATSPTEPCWRCRGERNLTAGQQAYLEAVDALRIATFPHCDARVLHSPGECRYCAVAAYARLHALRNRFDIAHTGALLEAGQEPCPSEAFRSKAIIDLWPGNRAAPPV